MYNTPELASAATRGFRHSLALAQRLFPKGQAVAIIEPYYKLMSDGSRGVRVDNPAEVGLCFTWHQSRPAPALSQQTLSHWTKCLARDCGLAQAAYMSVNIQR